MMSKESWEHMEFGSLRMLWSDSPDLLESKAQGKLWLLTSEPTGKNAIQWLLDETPPLAIKVCEPTKLHLLHSQISTPLKAISPLRTKLVNKSNNKVAYSPKRNDNIRNLIHDDHRVASHYKKRSKKPKRHSKKPSLTSSEVSYPITASIETSPQSSTIGTTAPSLISSAENNKVHSSAAPYSPRHSSHNSFPSRQHYMRTPSPSNSPVSHNTIAPALKAHLTLCPIFEMWQSALGKPYCPEGNACKDVHMVDGEFFYFDVEYDGEVDLEQDNEGEMGMEILDSKRERGGGGGGGRGGGSYSAHYSSRKHHNRESTHQSDNKSHRKKKKTPRKNAAAKTAYDSGYHSAEEPSSCSSDFGRIRAGCGIPGPV